MIVRLRIQAEPRGEFTQQADGTYKVAFPWPEPVIHHVIVPEPLQAGPTPSTQFWLAYRHGEPIQHGQQPQVLSW
jgi:hypothetical protein